MIIGWPALRFMKLQFVYLLQIGDDGRNAGGQLRNRITDKNRRCHEARHDFGGNLTVYIVEEDIVTVAISIEMVKQIVGANLQVVGHAVDLPEIGKPDVELDETDQRFVGDGKRNSTIRADHAASKTFRRNVGGVVDMAQTDDLHVRVVNGAARVGTVVFEEQHRGEFTAVDHIQPISDTKVDQPIQVVFRIQRQLARAVLGFDKDGLERFLQHRVFVGDEQERSVGGDNAGQLVAIAKRAFMANIYHGHRFSSADLAVKNEVGMPCGHAAVSLRSKSILLSFYHTRPILAQ